MPAASDRWMVCTDRLCLRLLRPDDASHLEQVVEPGWVAAMMAQSGDDALSPWAIALRDEGAVVGHCGFLVRPVKGTTMGYAIVPQYRGRGLATEAAAAVLDWAERHDVDVYASVRPPNPASVRVLERSACDWPTRTSMKTDSGTSTAANRGHDDLEHNRTGRFGGAGVASLRDADPKNSVAIASGPRPARQPSAP